MQRFTRMKCQAIMQKYLIIFFVCLTILAEGCKKHHTATLCTAAIIVNDAPSCSHWGIKVNGQTYPSNNIPDQFKQIGLKVCTNYTLYDDPKMCPCCGGTYANINSMQLQ